MDSFYLQLSIAAGAILGMYMVLFNSVDDSHVFAASIGAAVFGAGLGVMIPVMHIVTPAYIILHQLRQAQASR
jgi:hypothetical protein